MAKSKTIAHQAAAIVRPDLDACLKALASLLNGKWIKTDVLPSNF
jgi:Holliday junction resolvase RusA-like endonuclease